jgi:hypothetical protein
MPDEGIGDMTNDLAPVYTKTEEGEVARGIGRQAVKEIVIFYRSRVEHFSNMRMNCQDCRFLRGTYCQHWRDTVPDEFRATGCDDWQWDGCPW